jgi:hypothetical protein
MSRAKRLHAARRVGEERLAGLRQRQLQQIAEALREHDYQAVTEVIGPRGVGCTATLPKRSEMTHPHGRSIPSLPGQPLPFERAAPIEP